MDLEMGIQAPMQSSKSMNPMIQFSSVRSARVMAMAEFMKLALRPVMERIAAMAL